MIFTTSLAMIMEMARIARTANPETGEDAEKPAISNRWLRSMAEPNNQSYERIAIGGFIENYSGSGVFSPLCGELNLLLTAAAGELGSDDKAYARERIEEIMKQTLPIISDKIIKISNKIFIPEERTELHPEESNSYSSILYKKEDVKRLVKEYAEWVTKESDGKINASIDEQFFHGLYRIYSTLVSFKEGWEEEFDKKETVEDSFRLSNGSLTAREYLKNKEAWFRYKRLELPSGMHELVAVPYVGRSKSSSRVIASRFMIYLIPCSEDSANLAEAWKDFDEYSKKEGGVSSIIKRMRLVEMILQIPKIEGLRTKLDLSQILPTIASKQTGNNALMMKSEMEVFIQVDEEGTSAAAFANTIATDGGIRVVRANVPHLAFVYDTDAKRVLFIIKDVGPTSN